MKPFHELICPARVGRSGEDQNRIQETIHRVEKGKEAWEGNQKDMVREAAEKYWKETRREFRSRK